MSKEQIKQKKPISHEVIFRLMLIVTYAVAAFFLLKNLFAKEWVASAVIAMCLSVFAVCMIIFQKRNANEYTRQFAVSIGIVVLVFIISLFSGASYSDDFSLFLAVIGLSGMFLQPKITIAQAILIDVLLIIMYIVHPEKAGDLSQYITCTVITTLGAVLFGQTIKRGRAYIEIGEERAVEAERLLKSIVSTSEELKKNFEVSSEHIGHMESVNVQLEGNTEELRRGSGNITKEALEVANSCDEVESTIKVTEAHIEALNAEVKTFEHALIDNRKNINVMNKQMDIVKRTMHEANEVFQLMEEQMKQITEVTEQLNSISSSTNMLALNASIEAARAGTAGAGFAVVASKVQDLAVDSNACSNQVSIVVNQMREQVEKTTGQLAESVQAMEGSVHTLAELDAGFNSLTEKFGTLYGNIEAQNGNVRQVDSIFVELRNRIQDMSNSSAENQEAVEAIANAIEEYKENMNEIIDDTKQIQNLSASMLETSMEE